MKPELGSFLKWKQNLFIPPDLTQTDKGEFTNIGIQRQYGAYLQAVADYLPARPPKDVLDAMAQAGCRPEWVKDVYKVMRNAMLSESRATAREWGSVKKRNKAK